MPTLKSIPKAKPWYKHLKVGDTVLVQLHPKHAWYHFVGDNLIEVKLTSVYPDGCCAGKFMSTWSDQKLTMCVGHATAQDDWNKFLPATIIKKVKNPKPME